MTIDMYNHVQILHSIVCAKCKRMNCATANENKERKTQRAKRRTTEILKSESNMDDGTERG